MGFGGIGFSEILIILVVALLVVGPGRTISMAKTAGKMMGEVRRAMTDLTNSIEEEDRQSRPGDRSDGPSNDRG